MLASLKYGKELCSLSIQNLLSELIPRQNGDEKMDIWHHDMEASNKDTA